MVAYEFYVKVEERDSRLIGILPERRKNQERITEESILRWGREVVGQRGKSEDIFFVQVNV